MSQVLTFNNVTLTPVFYQNSLWIRATDLAQALGYKQGNSASRIYRQNADEFSADMTQIIEISEGADSALTVKTRIFSLRGCHLLAMFARTSVAKDFRRWVLDVLDSLAAEEGQVVTHGNHVPTANDPLTPDQQCTIKSMVKARVEAIPEAERPKGLYPQIWSRFNNHFRLGSYKQLPQCRMSEAIEYIMHMELIPQTNALPHGNTVAGLEALMQLGYMPYDPSPISHVYSEDRELDSMFRTIRDCEGQLECMEKANKLPPIPKGQEANAKRLRETFLASCYVARRALSAIFEMGRAARRVSKQKAIANA